MSTMTCKLICFDLDGVIFKDINFWMELHKKFGTLDEGKILTEKYLHTDYDTLVAEVVGKLWKGRDAQLYYELVASLEYLPGVAKTFAALKKKGVVTAIISASSLDCARRVQSDFGVDHLFANELVIRDGKITGEFVWPIGAGKHKKAEITRHLREDLGVDKKECVFVGDSETDIEAFSEVGLSIAFNCLSEKVKLAAQAVVEGNNLTLILPLIK